MKSSTRKKLQKQLDSIRTQCPPFKLNYRLPSEYVDGNDFDHFCDLCNTFDWALKHAFFDMIIDSQMNCETYMIIYIDFKKAVKVLNYIAMYASQDDETCGHLIECEKFFMDNDDFNMFMYNHDKTLNSHVNKRIEFINYKVKISDKELFGKWMQRALGNFSSNASL